MSHFSVLIIGPNIGEQLAPYQENNMGDCPKQYLRFKFDDRWFESEEAAKAAAVAVADAEPGYWKNPNAKWDFFLVGGRYSNRLLLRDGTRANQAIKGEVDFDGLRTEAQNKAAERYDRVAQVIGHLPPNRTWAEIRDSDTTMAREIYWAQPRCKAWQAAERSPDWPFHPIYDSPDQFLATREEFIAQASLKAGTFFALVMDGKWYERGSMGWWGIVSDEKDEETWCSMFHKLIASLPGDTQLTVVDCHI